MTHYSYSMINNTTIDYLDSLLTIKLEDEKSGFFTPENMKCKSVRVTQKKTETTRKIIDIVKPFFESDGMEVNPDNGYICYESYTYEGPQWVDTPYDISNENSEYYSDVNVCYLVTRKDTNLKRGNMYVYEEYPSFMQMMGCEKEKNTEVKLETGSLFLAGGDIYHKLDGCSGSGIFNIIRVVLYKEKRFGYQCHNDDD